MGGIFSDGTPVWGRGTPGVVFGVAQNGTVGCEKVHSRRVTTNLGKFSLAKPASILCVPGYRSGQTGRTVNPLA